MALNARLADLTSRLITSITQSPSNAVKTAEGVKSLKEHNYARVNQFAIASRLDGLNEKFLVLGRDDLAEALESRLRQLTNDKDKFLPDKLALLLALSDKPHEHVSSTTIDYLNGSRGGTTDPELSWDDIIRDDPLDEPELWTDVEHGYHSSGDEAVPNESDRDSSASTDKTSDSDNLRALARSHLIDAKTGQHELLVHRDSFPADLTEYDLLRETLFALRGLRSQVYELDSSEVAPYSVKAIRLSSTTSTSLRSLLLEFARIATELELLRKWTTSSQQVPHIRSCQYEVQKLLSAYHRDVSLIEEQIVSHKIAHVISLLHLLATTRQRTEALLMLSHVVRQSTQSSVGHSNFSLLDNLFSAIGRAHATGRSTVYSDLLSVFLQAVTTYLRPVELWCRAGQLEQDEDLFIIEIEPDCDKAHVWTRRYATRRADHATSSAPAFLTRHIDRIFACGKHKMFASHLMAEHNSIVPPSAVDLDFSRLRQYDFASQLRDFSHSFDEAVAGWLAALERSSDQSPGLRLVNDYGLLQTLDAYEHLYLCKDSILFSAISRKLFRHLDRPSTPAPAASFAMTEMLREAVSTSGVVDPHQLSVTLMDQHEPISQQHFLAGLPSLRLDYYISWPLVTVLQSQTPEVYLQVWILLLQAQRARSVLQRNTTAIRALHRHTLLTILRLRFYLLTFIDVLVSHITATCQALHRATTARMSQTTSIDDMIGLWQRHCEGLAKAALVAPSLAEVRGAIHNIFVLCEGLAVRWTALTQSVIDSSSTLADDRLEESIETYKSSLDQMIGTLHDAGRTSAQHEHLVSLADRLELCRYHR